MLINKIDIIRQQLQHTLKSAEVSYCAIVPINTSMLCKAHIRYSPFFLCDKHISAAANMGVFFFLLPSNVLVNERERYIPNITSHWLKPYSAIDIHRIAVAQCTNTSTVMVLTMLDKFAFIIHEERFHAPSQCWGMIRNGSIYLCFPKLTYHVHVKCVKWFPIYLISLWTFHINTPVVMRW